MNRLEEAKKAFLEVRSILTEKHEDFALAKAYKKALEVVQGTHHARSY